MLLKKIVLLAAPLVVFLLAPDAQAGSLLLKVNEQNWQADPGHLGWVEAYDKAYAGGLEVSLPPRVSVRAQSSNPVSYIVQKKVSGIDETRVRDWLAKRVEGAVFRERQDVIIDQDEGGAIRFEGFAMAGQTLDVKKAVQAIRQAYKADVDEVHLPVTVSPPRVEVKSAALKEKGIGELMATGITRFAGSPPNRITNIHVGLDRFNGVLIPPETTFSIGNRLGRVDETTGYKKELVIKGDKTLPEYGGGLCQVSTTIYRGALLAGLPITQRKNHSYAVSYYAPQGLDATIYPPAVDLKFTNDTKGHLLLQTRTTKDGEAHVNYYGTRDDRQVALLGPRYYSYTEMPPDRTEVTAQLPAGEKQKVGEAHQGFKASWHRIIAFGSGKKEPVREPIYSDYEARPLYYLVGEGTAKKASENGT